MNAAKYITSATTPGTMTRISQQTLLEILISFSLLLFFFFIRESQK